MEPTAPFRDQSGDKVALLVIDMINAFDFDGSDQLLPRAVAAAEVIAALRDDLDALDGPTIFINDNGGKWHSEKSKLIDDAEPGGARILSVLRPREHDYFVIKPQFSGFYATSLPFLLPKLGVRKLILTGVSTDICVLFTAADAYMRDYSLWVPENAVAAASPERSRWAIEIMRGNLGCETASTGELSLAQWLGSMDGGS